MNNKINKIVEQASDKQLSFLITSCYEELKKRKAIEGFSNTDGNRDLSLTGLEVRFVRKLRILGIITIDDLKDFIGNSSVREKLEPIRGLGGKAIWQISTILSRD